MNKKLIILLMILMGFTHAYAQEVVSSEEDEIRTEQELALPADSVAVSDSVRQKKNPLEAPVIYQAKDSIILTGSNWAYLFGESDVKYQNIQLQSEVIEMNMDSTIVYAKYGLDSIGSEFGHPIFMEGTEQYESRTMRYNFDSRKGFITDVITQQGEGYVTAGLTKKMEDDVLNMMGGRYTTCDDHDHPHFYIQMTKAKVRPGKNIVTGPVYLVIEDVPLPLALPFAFFPFSSSYSSGIIMPSFGDESSKGYNLREGGYYFAISDYVDLALTGDIYSKGSWAARARSAYRKRYKFSGSFDISYQVTKYGDKIPHLAPGKEDDYSLSKDFRMQWTHSQDAKANPYMSFSASVNYSTSNYGRNNQSELVSGAGTENTKSSSISLTKRFPNNPFTISATANVNQISRDSSIAVTLPNVSITMSRIYPFKKKNRVGSEKWYEKISMSYTGSLRNSIQTKDDLLFKSNLIKDWKNSFEHKIPVSATFTLFNYINISPTVNYSERWYTSKIEQGYDIQQQKLAPTDTTYGFYRIYDYNASISASTTLYGMYKPWAMFGNKVEMIRHRMEPSISFGFTPDFGAPIHGYWETLEYTDASGVEQEYRYSPFAHNGSIPGNTRGKSGSIGFSLDNNIEMKVRSSNDSIGSKKISLIDKLSFSGSYNLAVDSFNWGNSFQVNLRLKLSKSYTLNLTGTFDPYTCEGVKNSDGEITRLRRVNVPRWKAGKGIGRLMTTGTSFSYTFNNDTFKNLFGKKDGSSGSVSADQTQPGSEGTPDFGANNDLAADPEQASGPTRRFRTGQQASDDTDEDGYYKNTIPWSLSFSYSLRLAYDTQKIDLEKLEYKYAITHALSFSGNIQPSKNWRMSFNATYDFDNKKISYMTVNMTRNMHCFQMTASLIPIGRYKSYSFSVAVSSSLLKDLKYDRRSNYRDGQTWY